MDNHDKINQYDFVKIIHVPEKFHGVIDIGDVGVVIEKYDEETFEIECLTPDGSYKWLETLNLQYVSKFSVSSSAARQRSQTLMQKSIVLGSVLGAIFGALMGAGLGALIRTLNGIVIGLVIGLLLGLVTGALTAALTVKIASTTGGVGAGYFTGMVFGGALGILIGALIPASLLRRAHTEGVPVLDALMMGRFETAMLTGFLLSILATIIGVWIAGKNLAPRDFRKE